jgi:N-acetylmuramoyl-L-alanine amidase
VGRDGKVWQCASVGQRCNHAGISSWKDMIGLNSWFIGIEQANYGYWRTWKPKEWPKDFPKTTALAEKAGWIKARHKNEPTGPELWWEPWSETQLATTESICKWLVENIPTIKYIVGHDEASPHRKQDPGPAFPMARFRSILVPDHHDSLKLKVASPDGELNVRGPAPMREKLAWGPLKNGETVTYVREDGEWTYVKASKGEGWAYTLYLKAA